MEEKDEPTSGASAMTTTRNKAIEDARATIIRAIDFLDEERSIREAYNGWTGTNVEDVAAPKALADALHALLGDDAALALPEDEGWRPIESAPKDKVAGYGGMLTTCGPVVWLGGDGWREEGWFDHLDGKWHGEPDEDGMRTLQPTHWQQHFLPTPPKEAGA
jgi:hypothetical protein